MDLKRMLDELAKDEGVSTASLVIRACWLLLDHPVYADAGQNALPQDKTEVGVDSLRAICRGELPAAAPNSQAISVHPQSRATTERRCVTLALSMDAHYAWDIAVYTREAIR